MDGDIDENLAQTHRADYRSNSGGDDDGRGAGLHARRAAALAISVKGHQGQSKPGDAVKLVIKLHDNGDQLSSTTIEVRDPLRCTEEILKAISKEHWVLAEGNTITIQSAE